MNRKLSPRVSLVATCLVALLAIMAEPVAAEGAGEELEDVDWLGIIEALLRFFADILEIAADILRDAAEKFIELFG